MNKRSKANVSKGGTVIQADTVVYTEATNREPNLTKPQQVQNPDVNTEQEPTPDQRLRKGCFIDVDSGKSRKETKPRKKATKKREGNVMSQSSAKDVNEMAKETAKAAYKILRDAEICIASKDHLDQELADAGILKEDALVELCARFISKRDRVKTYNELIKPYAHPYTKWRPCRCKEEKSCDYCKMSDYMPLFYCVMACFQKWSLGKLPTTKAIENVVKVLDYLLKDDTTSNENTNERTNRKIGAAFC